MLAELEQEQEYWVTVPEIEIEQRGFINLFDLQECLFQHFAGTLDDIPDMSRVNMPLESLIPGKPLLSQVDSGMLEGLMSELSETHRLAIANYYAPTDDALAALVQWSSDHAGSFIDFCSHYYAEGILRLSDLLFEAL